ncbi:MAG TPA: hypothetical protein PK079_01645 [Leptospiraceae bacterium]|nr:hypothetical protein [Leptospiraceae bacterium]HMW04782.1 hypothetical protein [Leptospiraceae bacterium]HMX32799.1 hypothetical protein [Leptospiraceae bacterium]HMY33550.1 hypothetical protein [Leptospiraceae bacterium]HMZ65535.1 hypothetical protein [Leptospiraceae bacterium]
MSDKKDLESIFRLYLDATKRDDGEIIVLILNYLSHLFVDEEGENTEPILLEDFTHYEVDDFLNFYLEDNFENFLELQAKSKIMLRNFLKFLKERKYFNKEEVEEWMEILK